MRLSSDTLKRFIDLLVDAPIDIGCDEKAVLWLIECGRRAAEIAAYLDTARSWALRIRAGEAVSA
jgi:hypothetical protein